MDLKKYLEDDQTLFEYIEFNHKLLTTLGVFVALAVFSGNLSEKGFGVPLSTLFLSLSIFISIELVNKNRGKKQTVLLIAFKYCFFIAMLFLGVYWLISLKNVFGDNGIYLILILVIGGISAPLLGNLFWLLFMKNHPERGLEWLEKKKVDFYVGSYFFLVVFGSRLVTWLIPYVNTALAFFENAIKSR